MIGRREQLPVEKVAERSSSICEVLSECTNRQNGFTLGRINRRQPFALIVADNPVIVFEVLYKPGLGVVTARCKRGKGQDLNFVSLESVAFAFCWL